MIIILMLEYLFYRYDDDDDDTLALSMETLPNSQDIFGDT